MSEEVFKTSEPKPGLESHGPFQIHRITLDGYEVPRLHGRVVGDMWYFQLDGRFAVDVPKKYGLGVAWVIANALAIGAGYSCFGENSAPRNEFKNRLHCIQTAFTENPDDDLSEVH